jgi:hypothetical protein
MNSYEHAGKNAAIEGDSDVNRGHQKREAGGLLEGRWDDKDVLQPHSQDQPGKNNG